MEQIQKLPEFLTRAGNNYRLFKRGKQTLIYSEINSEGKDLSFEVFRIRIQPAGETFGRWYPALEKFPHSEAFGKSAVWCYSLEWALQWFNAFEEAPKGVNYGALRAKVDADIIQTQKVLM